MYFNLYNNIWNTNFLMWYTEDAMFRFVVTKNQVIIKYVKDIDLCIT